MSNGNEVLVLGLLQREHQKQQQEIERLKSGGGGGTSDGMEARVNRLEERIDKLGDRFGSVEVNLATLTERVAHLPSKGFMVKTTTAILGALTALILFADQIKGLVGIQ